MNREISAEVGDVFRKLYADRITFYSDNIVDLYPIWKKRKSWPILKNARFWIQAILEDTEYDGDAQEDGVFMLIDRQPGWKEEWCDHPGWLRTESLDFMGWDGHDRWDLEAEGFTRTTISHKKCIDSCVKVRKLVYPAMDKGCWMTTCRWRSEAPLDDFDLEADEPIPVDSGSMILRGRLEDLSWKDVPVKRVQKRMEHERQKRAEGREDEPCTKACGCYDFPIDMDDELSAGNDSDLDEDDMLNWNTGDDVDDGHGGEGPNTL